MTKEEILQACGEKQHGQSHYDGFKTVYNKEQFALNAMDEYAKQQAIAFFMWNCQRADHYLDYLQRVHLAEGTPEKDQELNRFENASIEQRYMLFIEQTKSPD